MENTVTARAWFLIAVAAVALHLSISATVFVFLGYAVCAYIDAWLARRAKNKVFGDQMYGWEVDPEDPTLENKGGLARVRLLDKDLIIVTRVAELLRQI